MQWPQISPKFGSCYKNVQSWSTTSIINLLPFAFSGAWAGWKLERWAQETSVSFHCLHLHEMRHHLVSFHLVEWNPAHQRPLMWDACKGRCRLWFQNIEESVQELAHVSVPSPTPKLRSCSCVLSSAVICSGRLECYKPSGCLDKILQLHWSQQD